MVGVYFSGTGNTKHCVQNFLQGLECCAEMYPIEKPHTAEAVKVAEEIVFGYPVYYSNLPKIVCDFITENAGLWQGKRIFIISTMAMFSGDGEVAPQGCLKNTERKVSADFILKCRILSAMSKCSKSMPPKTARLLRRLTKKYEMQFLRSGSANILKTVWVCSDV